MEKTDLILLEAKKVAEIFGIDELTLANWRSRKVGPPYVKVGHLVRYKLADIQAYIERNVRNLPTLESS